MPADYKVEEMLAVHSRLELMGRYVPQTLWGGRSALPMDLVFLLAVPSIAAGDQPVLSAGIAAFANQTAMLHRLGFRRTPRAGLRSFGPS